MKRDILLLASDSNSLSDMVNVIISSDSELESRIQAVHDCAQALHALNDTSLKVYVVDFDDNSQECVAHNIKKFILDDFDNEVFRIFLVKSFCGIYSSKKIIFNPSSRIVEIRRSDFNGSSDVARRILNTLRVTTDVCISYGNDESEELEDLIVEIQRNAKKVLPYVRVYFDRLVEYKEYASDLLEKIKLSPYVVIIFNEEYFRSINCILELYGIWESSLFSKKIFCRRIYPIVLESARDYIYAENSKSVEDLTKFWKLEKNKYPGKEKFIDSMVVALPEVLKIISDVWALKLGILKVKKLSPLLWEINCALAKNGFYNFYDKEEDMLEILK
ncbi:MAG: hypothetical protein RIR79_749 [Pseudomonadota bacterium]|jgi:hypothetical protein